MGSNGDELHEVQIGRWRRLIREMLDQGKRLEAVTERIDGEGSLTESERALLRMIARRDSTRSLAVERFEETAGDFGD
jgi:hypothetical protein